VRETGARLAEPLRALLGDKTAVALGKLGLRTVGDLLRHYPRRYAQRGELTDLASLRAGDEVTVLAEVRSVNLRKMKHRRGSLVEVVVTDGTGTLALTFFNQPWREKELWVGRRGLFAGKVGVFNRKRQLANPDYELLDDAADTGDGKIVAGGLIPVYPASAALPTWRVAKCLKLALDGLVATDVPDPLPPEIRRAHRLLGLFDALTLLHRPVSHADVSSARHRLRWDEAFTLQVVLAQRRAQARALPATPRPPRPGGLLEAFDAALPFALTAGQREVGAAIGGDLAREHPMHRLLQGEVGSGKTVIAVRAMLAVVDAGGQAALLAPTEVLAQQHRHSITALLGPLAEGGRLGGAEQGTRVTLLTGSQPTAVRRRALLEVASGEAGIVIGTHALLQESVDFFDLGLVVVDEQHRFGVEQRDALRAKAATPPHVLVMTATPIPRTVAMTVFGDLEVSTLTELPLGRAPIATHVVPAGERPRYLERTWERLREEVVAGHQAYVVCPRIGDGLGGTDGDGPAPGAADGRGSREDPDALFPEDLVASEAGEAPRRPPLAVLDVAPMLAEGPLAGLVVEVLHGRMTPEAKEAVMGRFGAGRVDVLVATTVIEVGVDVANASVMVVLDADRFGISQLHQLRGRVGRGSAPGLCLLVTDAPEASPARARLEAVAATVDGFELSRVDLEHRHEGDVLGAVQAGRRSSLRLLSVIRDEDVIVAAREEASALVAADPDLAEHLVLRAAVADLVDDERAGYLEKT
jgi:ATP-dependent DNA helicase RecG